MLVINCGNLTCCPLPCSGMSQNAEAGLSLFKGFSSSRVSVMYKSLKFASPRGQEASACNVKLQRIGGQGGNPPSRFKDNAKESKVLTKKGKKEHHLWKKRDSAGSGQKALNLLRIISDLPNEKEVVYGALDKWTAFEVEFPLIAAAKALRILRKRSQWLRAIQVAKWMLSKGQGATMATYDTLLLAFDKDRRVDEAESLWNMILHTSTRSVSKRLFSRMIALYDHHDMQDKIVEVFADMEELGVRPDEDTVRRIARAFRVLGQEEKQKLVLKRYLSKWKYIHFKGERVRVKRQSCEED